MFRFGGLLVAVLMALTSTFGAGITEAHADGYVGDFYLPPEPLPPGRPGDLLRTEPSRIPAAVDFPNTLPAAATRIMYRSADARGMPIAVTGTFIQPTDAWTGEGPRPLISYAVGTHGQGDQCAPSRLLNEYIHWNRVLDVFLEYELVVIQRMIKRGWALARDWCTRGADVEFFTNEQPPLFNKLIVNHAFPIVVDAPRALQWTADRFDGLPTTPNCAS